MLGGRLTKPRSRHAWQQGHLLTKDFLISLTKAAEIDVMLSETLIAVAKSYCGWDIATVATKQKERPLVGMFGSEIMDFSKFRLAKAFVRWSRDHSAKYLSTYEREQ
ncbi:hypothetical protein F3X89_22280 [Rhizobium rhizogenes]|uniref:hypothetical protein n=1 Tax=Rhizobium rhizogenes TaxID=359 RepID=UPI00193E45BC|nr:hypothetical protein [Rhizobium rhizogenes]QRM40543.1 hypothetical protein F3X89_22280 [Rhizobium rhizogenes]